MGSQYLFEEMINGISANPLWILITVCLVAFMLRCAECLDNQSSTDDQQAIKAVSALLYFQ